VPQDEASRLPHQAVQEEVERRVSHLQAAHRVVLLPRQDVSGGEVSGTFLPEHQAEVATTADAAEAAERCHDEAPNGSDERAEGQHEQFRRRKRPAEEHRKLGDASAAAATAAATAPATTAAATATTAAAAAAADDGAANAAAPSYADAAGTTRHEPGHDEQSRWQSRIAAHARSSGGGPEGSGGGAAAIESATAGTCPRLWRQGQPADDDAASAANGQCRYGSAGPAHDGRAAVAAAAATTKVPESNAATQPHAAAADANGCAWSSATAAAAAATARSAATAWAAGPAATTKANHAVTSATHSGA